MLPNTVFTVDPVFISDGESTEGGRTLIVDPLIKNYSLCCQDNRNSRMSIDIFTIIVFFFQRRCPTEISFCKVRKYYQ